MPGWVALADISVRGELEVLPLWSVRGLVSGQMNLEGLAAPHP